MEKRKNFKGFRHLYDEFTCFIFKIKELKTRKVERGESGNKNKYKASIPN
jgi:hypothetical protein